MAHNSQGLITAPVNLLSDVKTVLGATVNTTSGLCTHPNVNKWSKDKPQIVAIDGSGEPIMFGDQATREAAFRRGAYGIDKIPLFTHPSAMIDWILGATNVSPDNFPGLRTADSWAWRKPTTVFRIADFNYYYHQAQPIVSKGTPQGGYQLPSSGDLVFTFPLASNEYGITFADLCHKDALGMPKRTGNPSDYQAQYRLGMLIIGPAGEGGNFTTAVVTSPKLAIDEKGSTVTFTVRNKDFRTVFPNEGEFRAFIFVGQLWAYEYLLALPGNETTDSIIPVPDHFEVIGQFVNTDKATADQCILIPFPDSLSTGRIGMSAAPPSTPDVSSGTDSLTLGVIYTIDPTNPRRVYLTFSLDNNGTRAVYVNINIALVVNGKIMGKVYPYEDKRFDLFPGAGNEEFDTVRNYILTTDKPVSQLIITANGYTFPEGDLELATATVTLNIA